MTETELGSRGFAWSTALRRATLTSPAGPDDSSSNATGRVRAGRYEFLDALRGIAALAVVLEHFSAPLWPAYGKYLGDHVNPGVVGVFVFFIVSGFIIPASMERGRSLGAFWVGRFFRLFPLFWVIMVVAVLLHLVGMYGGPPGFLTEPLWNLVTNATMAHYFITGHDSQILVVAWTLSYELIFYALVSLLFLGRLNRRSVPVAILAIGAILAAALFLTPALLNGPDSDLTTRLAVLAATAVAAAFFAWRAPTRRAATVAVLIAALAIPLALNQPGPSGYSAAILATMFVGTVLYRMTAGDTPAWLGWAVFGLALCMVISFVLIPALGGDPAAEATQLGLKGPALSIIVAYALFAAALLLRRHSFPRPLLFLGRISFSLYLVHGLVTNFVPKWPTSTFGVLAPWLTWTTWLIVAMALSVLTYNKIEKPFLARGHRVMAKMDARG
ncbi:acyltransferase family protein [Nocardia lasii]|uniref:Acyltransferase family protein n=1 Tax=Nocardia lasii TaxID=1616107 RepID=A0ABW1JPS9_9NOCA